MKHLALIGIVCITCAAFACKIFAADAPPNMIFLMTDDQGWGDVAYNGHPKIKTPNLDAMAAAGLRFDRFYVDSGILFRHASDVPFAKMTGNVAFRLERLRQSDFFGREVRLIGAHRTGDVDSPIVSPGHAGDTGRTADRSTGNGTKVTNHDMAKGCRS